MPNVYFVEMMCDRIAASKTYLKDKYTWASAWEYYQSHKDENQFSDLTRRRLEYYLFMLKCMGEDYLFSKLRILAKRKDK